MIKLLTILFIIAQLNANDTITSQLKYSFINVNLNYLDWNHNTENSSAKRDFSYIGLEGGFGYKRIDIYAFLNVENPTHNYNTPSPSDLRFTSLIDSDIEIKNNFKIHFHNYYLNSDSFYVSNSVLGIGYKLNTNFGLWLRPYIGFHYTKDTYYNGLNGYMGGWIFNYSFNLINLDFNLSQWNEIEFKRDKDFYLLNNKPIGDGESWGLNGAISLWLNLNKTMSIGTQYRYAKNKLGYSNYQSAMIYTLKYSY